MQYYYFTTFLQSWQQVNKSFQKIYTNSDIVLKDGVKNKKGE